MNRRLAFTALIASLLTLALAGCGNKGPLVLPDKPAESPASTDAPATPATTQPANDSTPSAG